MFTTVFATGVLGPTLLRRLEFERRDAPVRAASYYPNCTAAHADGVYSIVIGAPAYRRELDADADGVACEPWRSTERSR